MLLHRAGGGGDTLLAFTCIWTKVGGWRSRELESPPEMESIPSGGVIGLQKLLTLETGAEYCDEAGSPCELPGVMAGEG